MNILGANSGQNHLNLIKINQKQSHRNFKDFGHKRDIAPPYTVIFSFFLVFLMFGFMVNWRWYVFIYHSIINKISVSTFYKNFLLG